MEPHFTGKIVFDLIKNMCPPNKNSSNPAAAQAKSRNVILECASLHFLKEISLRAPNLPKSNSAQELLMLQACDMLVQLSKKAIE
jgi:hypothetical protein